jgi:hypothetical protein
MTVNNDGTLQTPLGAIKKMATEETDLPTLDRVRQDTDSAWLRLDSNDGPIIPHPWMTLERYLD